MEPLSDVGLQQVKNQYIAVLEEKRLERERELQGLLVLREQLLRDNATLRARLAAGEA